MLHDSLLQEAHHLLHATPSISALEDIVRRVASGWCMSFGVRDEDTIVRLAHQTLKRMTAPNAGKPTTDIGHFIDMHAEAAIHSWFDRVQKFSQISDPQPLSLLRYAFLHANENGEFSSVFLHDSAPFADIAAALEVHDVAPTPVLERRTMNRQKI